MRVFNTSKIFIIILISNIVKICTKKVEVRVTATPMCIGGLFTGTSEDVKAELGKLGMKGHIKPKNTTDGLCNYRITNHANFTESDIKNSDIYVNYTYTSSHRNITKKIPDDCKDKDDYIQQDFDNKYHFLCNLGYLDPNPKNESENTTPVSGKYPSLLGNCGCCPK